MPVCLGTNTATGSGGRSGHRCALVHCFGLGDDGTAAWLRVSRPERRRTAMQAVHERHARTLWSLTEAWLRVLASVGATISAHPVRNYRTGLRVFLAA